MKVNQKVSTNTTRSTKKSYFLKNYDLYAMLLPGLILMIIFRFVPLYGMIIAFKDYDMSKSIMESPWVGFKWFEILFTNPDFLRSIKNTLCISGLEIIFCFFGTIFFALLINEIQSKGYKRVVQTFSYLPYFLSYVVVAGLAIQILMPGNSLMRFVSKIVGHDVGNILLKEKYFYGIVTAVDMWKTWGWGTILYLAAMSGISPELYEAAKIDGAGKFKQIMNVTLPGIKFIVVITLIQRIGSILGIGFEKIFVLQNAMNLGASEVLDTLNYKLGIINWNSSLSTAISFFSSIISFTLVFLSDRFAKMIGEEGLL